MAGWLPTSPASHSSSVLARSSLSILAVVITLQCRPAEERRRAKPTPAPLSVSYERTRTCPSASTFLVSSCAASARGTRGAEGSISENCTPGAWLTRPGTAPAAAWTGEEVGLRFQVGEEAPLLDLPPPRKARRRSRGEMSMSSEKGRLRRDLPGSSVPTAPPDELLSFEALTSSPLTPAPPTFPTLPSPPAGTAMGSALLACNASITCSNVCTSSLCSLR
mmetsp:Transcript_14791/g.32222  ORF Transcript_14791/g.32222 Transcript_14791/m.32222 type:complete len:221 (-) Transcript_14791:510-1172(-)